MRIITFKQEKCSTDPVHVGDILRVRRGNKWNTVIAANEEESVSCEGCLFNQYDRCGVPYVKNSATTKLCVGARCIFKELDPILENL